MADKISNEQIQAFISAYAARFRYFMDGRSAKQRKEIVEQLANGKIVISVESVIEGLLAASRVEDNEYSIFDAVVSEQGLKFVTSQE